MMALGRSKPKTLIQGYSADWLPPSSLFTNQCSRGFISESGVVFNFVQRSSNGQELLSHNEMIRSSRKYRSVIHSWYIKIINELADSGDTLSDEEKNELNEQSKILHKMEIAWHLCEILYINVSSASTLLVQLLNWIKWHFTYYVELADQMIVSDLPQMHQYYWDVIMFFALRGDMEHASLFLELHSESKTDPAFIVIRDLLKKFPLINNDIVVHEYFLRWGFWHESVLQAINDGLIPKTQKRSHIQLNLLLNLLAGDLESFKKVTFLFHSWYQMMVSYALFTDPCLKGDIDTLIEKFIDIFYSEMNLPNHDRMTMFDKLIRSAFDYDLIEVIKQSSMCFDDKWWFVTHFVDLIYNSSRYSDYQIADIGLIRDYYVMNYANSLFDRRKQFWQLSIEYLIHCKDSRQHILTCLERVPFENERELQRLITTCKRFNFTDLENSLYRMQSRKWLNTTDSYPDHERKYGSALFWAIRSKDKMLINHIVDQFLYHYLRCIGTPNLSQINNVNNKEATEEELIRIRGKQCPHLLDDDVIANIGGSIVLSERLIFLCKYQEFHQLCCKGQNEPAAKILIDMLASNAIPDFFQFQVIQDCLSLLSSKPSDQQYNNQKPCINSEQTCKIVSSLENLLYRIKKRNNHSTAKSDIWAGLFSSRKLSRHEATTTAASSSLNLSNRRVELIEKRLRLVAAQNLARNYLLSPLKDDNDEDGSQQQL